LRGLVQRLTCSVGGISLVRLSIKDLSDSCREFYRGIARLADDIHRGAVHGVRCRSHHVLHCLPLRVCGRRVSPL